MMQANRYRVGQIAELVQQQLRFSPPAVRARQMEAAERFLREIRPETGYSSRQVCYEITGYRVSPAEAADREDSVLSGADLHHDLRCLVEDLSESLELKPESAGEPVLTIAEISARYNVSVKTVERWRDRGLATRRYCMGARMRLGVPESSLKAFVAKCGGTGNLSGGATLVSEEERVQVISEARRLAGTGLNLSAVCSGVAESVGRSEETIRRLIREHDRDRPGQAVFRLRSGEIPAEHLELMYEMWSDGVGVTELSRRFGAPARAVKAALQCVRAHQLLQIELPYIDSDEFRESGAANRICREAPGSDGGEPRTAVPTGLPAYLAELYRVPLLNREQEQHYFRLLNFCKHRFGELQGELDPRRPGAASMDEMDSLLAEVDRVTGLLIRSNLRLVVSVARKHMSQDLNFFELVSDGNVSLIRAVDKFDYSRGNKFSTYATWAIMKNFARSVPAERRQRDRYRTSSLEMLSAFSSKRGSELADHLKETACRDAVASLMEELSGREQKVIACRFGLGAGSEPETLEQVGNRLGVTRERVRQIEAQTLRKLRRLAGKRRLEVPGV